MEEAHGRKIGGFRQQSKKRSSQEIVPLSPPIRMQREASTKRFSPLYFKLTFYEMLSFWMYILYGVLGGFGVLLLPKICLCCLGFTCCGIRKNSCASYCQSGIGDVEADSLFAITQGAGAGGCPCYITLMLFLLGFAGTIIVLYIHSVGGFYPNTGNSTTVDGNFTSDFTYLYNITTPLSLNLTSLQTGI
ncbi:uncharacterized protein TNCT_130071 [Trichonephila clavata]|uniref:Uncharacterized protein n=1 Tax=Trichonephila clavata TaxID=2740835 RepID=A0A8X6KXK8_TRICU|nr:uncharacterized protein TNCT_130071 [Trichonephila clavata]